MGGAIDVCVKKYAMVATDTTDDSGGFVADAGQKFAITRFRANGADPSAYVILAWDWGGASEDIIASTKGDVDLQFNSASMDTQFTGDGTKKLQVIIVNDNATQTPYIGGCVQGVFI